MNDAIPAGKLAGHNQGDSRVVGTQHFRRTQQLLHTLPRFLLARCPSPRRLLLQKMLQWGCYRRQPRDELSAIVHKAEEGPQRLQIFGSFGLQHRFQFVERSF